MIVQHQILHCSISVIAAPKWGPHPPLSLISKLISHEMMHEYVIKKIIQMVSVVSCVI